jgi:hypothetical protein
MATQIPRHHTMWFFLVGIHLGPCVCTTSSMKPSGSEGTHYGCHVNHWHDTEGLG